LGFVAGECVAVVDVVLLEIPAGRIRPVGVKTRKGAATLSAAPLGSLRGR